MSPALIVIEVAAPGVPDEALDVLVASCTRAARDATCVLAKDERAEQQAIVAIVSEPAADALHVEVGVREGGQDSWRTKDFAFLESDAVLDRFRVVGFAIGTLAEGSSPPLELDSPPAPKPLAPAPAKPNVLPPARRAPPPKIKSSAQLFVGASLISGPGLNAGPWRLGGMLYADVAPRGLPIFFTCGGSAATRVRSDETGTTARWFDISCGAGVPLLGDLPNSGLELRAQALAEEFDVSVNAPASEAEERSRWVFGVQAGLAARLRIVSDLLITAGLGATGLSSTTDVRVADHAIGSSASFRYQGSVGLRVRLR